MPGRAGRNVQRGLRLFSDRAPAPTASLVVDVPSRPALFAALDAASPCARAPRVARRARARLVALVPFGVGAYRVSADTPPCTS